MIFFVRNRKGLYATMIHSFCQHLSGNLKASQVHTLFHAYFYTFSKAFLFCRINGALLIASLVAPYLLLNLV